MTWALVLVPLAIVLDLIAPQQSTLIFFAAGLAIVPLAAMIGQATGELTHYTGAGVGGLLLATFGNTAEMVLTVSALAEGLHEVAKASIAGCIIGNCLLVLGASMFAGGLKHRPQRFNTMAAGSQATMLMLAVIALFGLAAFRSLVGPLDGTSDATLSLAIAGVLLLSYGCNLVYALITHSYHFSEQEHDASPDSPGGSMLTDESHPSAESNHQIKRFVDRPITRSGTKRVIRSTRWSLRRAIGVLVAGVAVLTWISQVLCEALAPMTDRLGLTPIFVGAFVVAIFGVAAEFAAALKAALRNRIDLSLSVTLGASVQIALFVAPTLIALSHVIGPQPMDLMFGPGSVLAVFFAVLLVGRIAGDGEADWLKGVQLLAVYGMFAILFLFAPALPPGPHGP